MKPLIRRERLHWHGGRENLKIAHLSDLHVKWSRARLDHLTGMLRAEQPDLVLMTGDYYDTPRGAALVRDFMEETAARWPLCWISGNHDRWFGPDLLCSLQEVPGAHPVDDDLWAFESAAGHEYHIMSWTTHLRTPLPREQSGVRRVVLLHNPEDLGHAPLLGCDLLLAGHLHGGQFVFWKTAQGHTFPASLLYRWCCQRTDLEHGSVMVSRGLGDTIPLRFRCPREIVCVEIS